MIQYQRRTLNPVADVGQPGPVPQALRGLADVSLADLPAALNPAAVAKLGLANTGYFPVDVPDTTVPAAITRLQFITALQNAGSYAAVSNAIGALANGDPVKIYFLNAGVFRRDDPRLLAFATSMNQTQAQVDTLFIAAAQIAA